MIWPDRSEYQGLANSLLDFFNPAEFFIHPFWKKNKGEYQHGRREGHGKIIRTFRGFNETLVDDYSSFLLLGIMRWPDGGVYDGFWQNDMRHGKEIS